MFGDSTDEGMIQRSISSFGPGSKLSIMQVFKSGIYDVLKSLKENWEILELDKTWKVISKGKYDDLIIEEQILNSKKLIMTTMKQNKVTHSAPLNKTSEEQLFGLASFPLETQDDIEDIWRLINSYFHDPNRYISATTVVIL